MKHQKQNKKMEWKARFVKDWDWLHDLVDEKTGVPFGEMNELIYEISQLLQKETAKARQEERARVVGEIEEEMKKLRKYCEDCRGNTVWLDEVLRILSQLKEKSNKP